MKRAGSEIYFSLSYAPETAGIAVRSWHYRGLTFGGFRRSASEDPAMNAVSQFLRNEGGATAIEYALIAGGIALVIIASVSQVGTTLQTVFEDVDSIWP
jgi:pilus assembly protein Flp/PilA